MKKLLPPSLLFFLAAPAVASDLNVNVQSGGQSLVKVSPGAAVSYAVVGELSDGANEGLAMFAFDLAFSGGALPQADTPTSNPMLNFATPLGLNNPTGFGGKVVNGTLVEAGGAQNTILSTAAPKPTGTVITGVAKPGSPATLLTGSLAAPMKAGTYTLSLSNLFANAIRQGETGVPFWRVDPANPGTITNLTVEVEALKGDVATLSLAAAPVTQTLTLDAGTANGGRIYWLFGTVSGTSPGIPINPNVTLPLNLDPYLLFTVNNPNTTLLSNSLGTLNAQGQATATFNLPAGLSPSLAGITAHHAYLLFFPINFASNPVSVTLVP